MKIKHILLALAFSASTSLLIGQEAKPGADGQPSPPPPGGPGFHLLPRGAQEKLSLTTDQQTQLSALEKEVRAKIEKILTPEQLEKLKQMRPPQGQRGPGGPGGPGEGRRPEPEK